MIQYFCDACKTKNVTALRYNKLIIRDSRNDDTPRKYEICEECTSKVIDIIGAGTLMQYKSTDKYN